MGNVVCECFEEKKAEKVSEEKQGIITKKDSRGTSKPTYTHSEPEVVSPTSPSKTIQSKPSIKEPSTSNVNRVDSYQCKRYLGKGSFGSVVLVQRKNTPGDKLYAMKVIDKSQIRQNNLLQSEVIEKVLTASQNDFLVKIIETFQNTKKVYIVMQYIQPGDLYYYMKKRPFTEDIIRSVVSQVVEAISFLHSKDIIYRDMKPQNILITTDGHIKLTDFGLSRLEIDNKPTFTFAGNLEYMSPEVLETDNKGYGKMVDLWSLGILIYELKHGCTPFYKKDDEEAFKKRILDLEYTFKADCSEELKDIVTKLLVKQPTQRLSLVAVREHPFFKGINWRDVKERKNPAPIKDIINQVNIKFKGADEHHQRAFRNPAKDSYSPDLHEFTYEESLQP